jgi:hypothetical protein
MTAFPRLARLFCELRPGPGAALALLLAAAAVARPAHGQQWAQTAEIITSVKSEQPTRVFLDSLVNELRARDSMRVRREPGRAPMTLSDLQDDLLEQGLGLFSANRVLIGYTFRIRDNEFIETIRSFRFIFRSESADTEDVSILYATGDRPAVRHVLRSQGIPNPRNLEAITYFKDALSFASLSLDQGADMVAVGGRPVRGEFDQRRKALLDRFKRFIYKRDQVYVTTVE